MKKLNAFLILILFGFGVIVQTAHSVAITKAPNLGMGKTTAASKTTGPSHNARLAIAPYAQVVPNNSYTFIGVTHPSLSTAHTSIGLVVEAMDMAFTPRGSALAQELRAVVFTVNAGETHRIFIVNEGHATIKASNTAFTTSNNTHLITTTDASQFGSVRVTSIGAHPNERTHSAERGGRYEKDRNCATAATVPSCVQRYDNLNQLSLWGVVYQESNGAGFSLEFIGDMHDSSAAGVNPWGANGAANHMSGGIGNHTASGVAANSITAGAGRGIN